jgi:hypothetical protein
MYRRHRVVLYAASALLAGCPQLPDLVKPAPPEQPQQAPQPKPPPTKEQIYGAFVRLNQAFQAEYERILDERGVRAFAVPRADAFNALSATMVRLGMIVESRDPLAGTLTVASPAPRPLDAGEWTRAAQADLAMMQGILCPTLGDKLCRSVRFDPDDYVIVINSTVVPAKAGSEVSLTARMREIAPTQTGLPRRDYPPPTAVRMALDKIWQRFEQELRAAGTMR